MAKYLTLGGLEYFKQKLQGLFAPPVHTHTAQDITDLSIVRAVTIDFQDTREIVQMRNIFGINNITKIVCDNVSTLRLSLNGTLQTITLTNGVWTGSISIEDNALMVWQIGRTTEGSIASINIQYN